MVRVADYVIDRLYNEGAKHIFMVTGRGILYLTDAIAKHRDIKPICVHHEQAAGFAAMAYAQYNGQIGACLVSTGCAGTNAITPLLCAWQDDVPCVIISGQNILKETTRYTGISLRTFGQQEADIIGLVEPLTKYATMITDESRVAYEMDKALFYANSGRKGPVWIDIPLDIQNMRVEPSELARFVPDCILKPTPDLSEIEFVRDAFRSAERPVLLIGSGVRSSGAIKELKAFLADYKFPIVYSSSAVDTIPSDYPLAIGAVGTLAGNRAANFAIQNSDLILAIGSRLSPMTTGPVYEKFARKSKLIVVDIDRVEHTKNTVRVDRVIVSDALEFLKVLHLSGIQAASAEWLAKCQHWKHIFPYCEERHQSQGKVDLYWFAECMSSLLDDNANVLTDAGLEELIIPTTIHLHEGQRCIHPASQGAMGYALPAAMGVYCASGIQTVAVIGDGSVMMNIQELLTIGHNQLPIKIVVINNNMYSIIRRRQVELFRNRTIGTDSINGVGTPDFRKIAESFNISYIKIEDSENLVEKLKAFLILDGPVLCEILAVEEQDYIRTAYAHDSKRRIVQRPLEDQEPFLDRGLFLSEMIIESIDQ